MQTFEWFMVHVLPYILVGGYAGWIGSRYGALKYEFEVFKDTKFKWVQDDARDLKKDSYNIARVDYVHGTFHALEKRILVLETKLDERFGVDK
jgi:hypothetical protein